MKAARFAAILAVFIAVATAPWVARAAEGSSSAAAAEEEQRKANAECLACHSEEGLKNPPRPDMNLRGLARLMVSGERFYKSVHGEDVMCKDCHGESYVQYPHAGNSRYQIKTCPECHKSIGKKKLGEFEQTLHYKNHPLAFTCQSCHDPHALQVPKQLGSAKRVAAQDNTMCRDCHDSDYRWGQFTTRPRPNLLQVHSWQPNPELHWQSVRCVDCHTPVEERGTSHLILGKDKAERDCATCHNASSSLRTRLYRYFSEQKLDKEGFLNAAVLNEAYVVGATRNAWIDTGTWLLTGLVLAGLAIHGLLRIIAGVVRKGRD